MRQDDPFNTTKNHPDIKNIKGKDITINLFSFRLVTHQDAFNVISTLDNTKPSNRHILSRVLKDKKNIYPQVVYKWINHSLKTGAFCRPFKIGRNDNYRQSKDPFDEDTYRPVRILSLI